MEVHSQLSANFFLLTCMHGDLFRGGQVEGVAWGGGEIIPAPMTIVRIQYCSLACAIYPFFMYDRTVV